MKKKFILFIFIFCMLLLIIYWFVPKHPLLGEWESKKGEGVGFMIDPKAPYHLLFTQNEMKISDKVIAISGYTLITDQENIVFVHAENGAKLKIKLLENDNIRFYFPGIGLRQYNRKNKWNFFSK